MKPPPFKSEFMTSWCGFEYVMLPKGLVLPSLCSQILREEYLLWHLFPHLWTNVMCLEWPVNPKAAQNARGCDRNSHCGVSREWNSHQHPPDPSWIIMPAVNPVGAEWTGCGWVMIPEPQRDFCFGCAHCPLSCVTTWASLHGYPVAGLCWTDDHCWWVLPWVLSLIYKVMNSSVEWFQAQSAHLDLLEGLNKSCKSPITSRPHCWVKRMLCIQYSAFFCRLAQLGSPGAQRIHLTLKPSK